MVLEDEKQYTATKQANAQLSCEVEGMKRDLERLIAANRELSGEVDQTEVKNMDLASKCRSVETHI